MRYATIALRPETKARLDDLRRSGGFASMDELVAAAVAELEAARTAAEVRRLATRRRGEVPSVLDEAEAAFEGLDDSIRAVRKGMRRRLG
jgi:Arc/MetJ-type ribon-helix-helix transcriptional regulator